LSDPVQIRIDLTNGAVEVNAPVDAIDSIFARLESFIPLMVSAHAKRPTAGGVPAQDLGQGSIEEADTSGDDSDRQGKGVPKKKGSNRAKETYKIVEFAMDADKRQEYRAFYASKSPSGQNDQTLVVMYGLASSANLASVDKNEIYSGFRLIDDVSVPGKISSVLGNLGGGGFVQNVGNGKYKLTHVGEDRVKLKLPATSKKSK